jgi:hypothetical protein
MIPKGLFTQIAMIGLSIGIFFTYIQPTFSTVKANQDTILNYQQEEAKVTGVNAKLNELIAASDQITLAERSALNTYVPNEVDIITVQRTLLDMAESLDIELTSLASAEVVPDGTMPEEGAAIARSTLVPYTFELGFVAPYDVFKEFLALLEVSEYPLVVSELAITGAGAEADGEAVATDTNEVSVTLTLETYALSMEEGVY